MTTRPKKLFKNSLWLAVLCGLLFSISYLDKNIRLPLLQIPKQESALNINEKFLTIFSMGNKRMIASLLWVQTLLESDIDHYKQKDLNSWMYLRFKSIIATDPNFYEAYLYGGQYLSIIKDDKLGAADLLLSGTKIYPYDFWLNNYLAFHYYFELGDSESAFQHYNRIINHPLTKIHLPYLPSLMARLRAEQGCLEDAYILLKANYLKTPEGDLKKKYNQSLYAIKAQLDLDCLNKRGAKFCDLQDWEGRPYLKSSSGKYSAKLSWQPFRMFKKKN